jgi:hypothetical protein
MSHILISDLIFINQLQYETLNEIIFRTLPSKVIIITSNDDLPITASDFIRIKKLSFMILFNQPHWALLYSGVPVSYAVAFLVEWQT